LKKIKIIVSVTNDLSSDQRVHKVCNTLYENGYEVTLIGRNLKNSVPILDRIYNTRRMNLFFNRGMLFYAEFQIRLFFFLLFTKFDVAHSNDLDTLLPNYLASKIKRKKLVYDTHEYFTEVPELQNSPLKKNIWEFVEKLIFPNLKYVFTVNESIAEIYQNKYKVPVKVIRNVPVKKIDLDAVNLEFPIELNNKKYIILQGAGINIDRGAEELIESMLYVDNAILLIIGDGDVLPKLKEYVKNNELTNKVYFLPKQPYKVLMQYTKGASIGITLDKDTNLNYQLSLPNKIFDYIRAGIPILASPLVETKRIFNEFEIGCLIKNHSAEEIASKINYMISSDAPRELWKNNLQQLSKNINWETESKVLIETYIEINYLLNKK